MRKIALCLCLALIGGYARAQEPVVKNHWYLSAGALGSPSSDLFGFELGLNYVYNEKVSFELSVNPMIRAPHQEPNDVLYQGPDNWESSTMNALEIGRIVKLNKLGRMRLNLKGGVTLMSMEVQEWTRVDNPCLNCNNYAVTETLHLRPGFVFRPTLEIPVFSFVGVSAGPMLILAKDHNIFGGGISLRTRLHGKRP